MVEENEFEDFIEPPKKKSRMIKIESIRKYLIVILGMSLKVLPDYTKHRQRDSWYGTKIIQDIMSRNEFQEVHKYFHFNTEEFIKKFNNEIKNIYNPARFMSIDESLSGFRGRYKYIQYIPSKPDKYGLKFFCLADASGYFYDIWLYKGSESQKDTSSKGIVLEFIDKLPIDHQNVIFCDNYYGSFKLAAELQEMGIDFVMNVRENRPTFLFKEGLYKELSKKGNSSIRYSPDGKLLAFSKWDKKKFNLITNCYTVEK